MIFLETEHIFHIIYNITTLLCERFRPNQLMTARWQIHRKEKVHLDQTGERQERHIHQRARQANLPVQPELVQHEGQIEAAQRRQQRHR